MVKEYCQIHKKHTKFIKIEYIRINENVIMFTYKCKKCFKNNELILFDLKDYIKR